MSLSGSTLTHTNESGTATALALPFSKLGSSINVQLSTGTTQTYGGRSFAQLNFGTTARQTGDTTLLTRNANGTVQLAAGYRYRISPFIQIKTASQWTAWCVTANGAPIDTTFYMPSGFNGSSSMNGRTQTHSVVYDATTSTAVAFKNFEGDSASSWQFEYLTNMLVEVVGIL